MFTVVIDKIGKAYAKKGAIKARVKASHALSLDNATNGIIGRRLSALGFDLGAGGERDEWVSVRPISTVVPPKMEMGWLTSRSWRGAPHQRRRGHGLCYRHAGQLMYFEPLPLCWMQMIGIVLCAFGLIMEDSYGRKRGAL